MSALKRTKKHAIQPVSESKIIKNAFSLAAKFFASCKKTTDSSRFAYFSTITYNINKY